MASIQYGYGDGARIVPFTGTLEMVLRAAFGRTIFRRTVTGTNTRFEGGLLDGAEIRFRDGLPSGERVYGEWEQLVGGLLGRGR